MEEKCPECGNFLITKTIKKQLGHGSIDYPVSQLCPKCNWSKDLTGAGDIVPKPAAIQAEEIKKEVEKPAVTYKPVKSQKKAGSSSSGMNFIIIGLLAVIVVGGIALAFLQVEPKQQVPVLEPTPVPTVTAGPVPTATVVTTSMPVAEATPTGVEKWIQLDYYRIFRNDASKIKVGDKVTWRNIGNDPFILLSNDIPDFGEKLLDNDKKISYIFMKPGNYSYYLKGKENLNGTIVVEP